MIITLEEGQNGFDAPYRGHFTIRVATSFTEGELASADLRMFGQDQNGAVIEVQGDPEGTDALFPIEAMQFAPGLWELNFRAVVNEKPHEFAEAIAMNVLERGVSRWPKSGAQQYPFQ